MTRDLRQVISGVRRRVAAAADALRGRTSVAPVRPEEWWDLLPFTTHRIELSPGRYTCAEGVDARNDVRTQLVVEACGGSMDGRSVVDLGSLEGAFTLAFAQRGAKLAIGIEARDISVRRAELARDLLGLTAAEFVVADIKDELVRRDPFDVVFAAGILYHVADPAALLRTMRQACTDVALIDTHVAGETEPSHGCSPIVERESNGETYRGRVFPEYAPDVADEDKEDLLWAAYSDVDSFWPLEAELVRMVKDAGFSRVEKVDPLAATQPREWGVDHLNRVVYRAYV
jgi:SAM-dependent methyltransferase